MVNKSLARLLFAGGCHVKGYPLGEQYSFCHLTSRALESECITINRVSLRNSRLLIDYLEKSDTPDVLILQVGNYESPLPIKRYYTRVFPFLKSFGWAMSSSSPAVTASPPIVDKAFCPGTFWRERIWLKRLYAALAQRTRLRLFDQKDVRERLGILLHQIQKFNIPQVVILSPLPCADHMARRFRLQATPLFEQESAVAGHQCLNTGEVLRCTNMNCSFDVFTDERHLNSRGHALLAEALISLIGHSRKLHLSAIPQVFFPPRPNNEN